jgi:hypothetical protein
MHADDVSVEHATDVQECEMHQSVDGPQLVRYVEAGFHMDLHYVSWCVA